ncbi:MAG: hypothetical protein J7M20_10795 [Deltaproteobacteria bacterium]|nr:hypothetical protein [Deltaproteobacteria bacterium]
MRVADPEAIRKGEKALADAIASNFDRSVIQEIFKKVHNLDVGEDIKCKNASMVVHGDKVAYSMSLEVLVNLSVFLDRSGKFISISSSDVAPESSPETEKPMVETPAEETADAEPQSAEVQEGDASASGGSYESVLREFAPIEAEKPNL